MPHLEAHVVPTPLETSVLIDARGSGRAMRVTWHHEAGDAGLVVLSLWHDEVCVGSFRLEAAHVPALVTTLVNGLDDSCTRTSRASRSAN